ncbi:MAG: EF-hand domain-containing protein, partial [Verrucomicrobiae bacterium]|nr:EF-hand domain-containing protein [Verrucomicrobiae bacterium]
MSRKKTLLIAAGTLAVVGAFAGAMAQGGRHGHWGGPMGDDQGFHGPRMGGFAYRFRGTLSKEDFDGRARERFARIDKNSDGVLDAAEIEAAMSERGGWRGRMGKGQGHGMRQGGRMGERMLKRFDTNNDGKVTAEEHTAGLRKLFAEMDLDNDGKITDADLPPMMRGRNALAADAAGPG